MWKRARTIDLQPWPFDDRPRVLIEHADPHRGLELATAIRGAGFAVGVCRGPDTTTDPARRCPLHRHQPCIAVEGADVVVTALDLESREGRDVVRGLRTRYPRTPLVVLATVGDTIELGDALTGCTVLGVDSSPTKVAAAVTDAIPMTSRP